MIVYNVADGDELDECFPTKREALAVARENDATVTRIRIPALTRQMVCNLINRSGYAEEQTVIYTPPEEPVEAGPFYIDRYR